MSSLKDLDKSLASSSPPAKSGKKLPEWAPYFIGSFVAAVAIIYFVNPISCNEITVNSSNQVVYKRKYSKIAMYSFFLSIILFFAIRKIMSNKK